MSILINKPLVVATTQELQVTGVNISFVEGYIDIISIIRNENGDIVDSHTDRYSGDEANSFWTIFTSTQSLYEAVVAIHNINVIVPVIPDVIS